MRNRRAFFVVLVVGVMVFAFAAGMFMMDVQHGCSSGEVGFWSVIRLVAAGFLIAIAAEDALTKEIHDVLLLGLGLVGVGALLVTFVDVGSCQLSYIDFIGFAFGSSSGAGADSVADSGFAFFQLCFSEPESCGVSAAGRIAGGLCVSLPMLAVSLIWSGSFGSGDVLMCVGAGLILGPAHTLFSVAIAMVLSGALSAVLLLFGILKKTDSIPFGPFLSIGFLFMLYLL